MQVTVETTGNLERRMTVAVPADRLEKEFVARLRRLSQTARFPGFRPGKAPIKMVEAQYGGKVLEEVADDLIRSTFYEAVVEKGMRPAGGPNIQPKHIGRGQDFEYTATFEIYPEVTRLEIKGCRIDRPVVMVTDADIDRTIDTLRQQRVSWQPVERVAIKGDQVIIDFEGSIDGVPFDGGSAKDFPLVLGNNVLIAGFEEGLIGAKAGEKRDLDLAFPEDYRNAKLAGKSTKFSVAVKQVNIPVLPEANEDFAKAMGVVDGKIETLRAEVRANLEREMTDRLRRDLREQVFKLLVDVNTFEIPKALETAEIERLIQMTRANFEAQGMPGTRVPTEPGLYAEQARGRAKLGLILAELVKAKGLQADAAKMRARVELLAGSYENPQEFVSWYYAKPERLAEIESQVLEDEAIDLLLKDADVADKPMSFQELMKPAPGRA
ncbi:MAG: trigger factor [Gammaproteobacteria bacterium]|nr:trigger factor [Gammaproteobacteria bacterium]